MKDRRPTSPASKKPSTSQPSTLIPWWISIMLAIVSYCSLKFLAPELHPENPTLQKLIQAAPSFAPLATIPFLLLAAKQLYDGDISEKESNAEHTLDKDPEK